MLRMKQAVIPGTQLPSTIGTLYTCPIGVSVMIKRVTLFNTNTSYEEVEFRILKSGGTTGNEYIFVKKTIADNETFTFIDLEGHVLSPGDAFQGFSTTADVVNVFMSVLEQT